MKYYMDEEIAENKVLKTYSDYIDSLHNQIKRLEDELKDQKSLIPWIGELAQARVRIKELERQLGSSNQIREEDK